MNGAALLWFGPYATQDEAMLKVAADPNLLVPCVDPFGRHFAVPRPRLDYFWGYIAARVAMESPT